MDKNKCASCVRNNEEVKAILWCNDCCEELCGPCGKVHRRFVSPHDVVNLQDVPDVCRSISKTCQNHDGIPLNIFCIQHDTLLCHQCLTEYHSKCTNILPIEKASIGIKDGDNIHNLRSRMESLQLRAKEVNKKNDDRSSKLENETCMLLDHISKIKSTINETLDRETKRVISKYKEFNRKTSEVDHSLSTIQGTLDANIKALDQVQKSASESYMFHVVKLFENMLAKYENEVELTGRSIDFMKLRSIPASVDKKMSDFLQLLEQTILTEPTENSMQAQLHVSPLNRNVVQRPNSFKPQSMCSFYGGCFTGDDHIILLELKHNRGSELNFCIIQRQSGKINKVSISEYPSCIYPNCVTTFQGNHALVTWRETLTITVVDIQQLQVSRRIYLNIDILKGNCGTRTKECTFIHDIAGEIWVCILYNDKSKDFAFICNIDFNGKILKHFPVDPHIESMCYRYVSNNGVFIYSHRNSNTIFMISKNGHESTYYKSIDLRHCCKIASCRDGIVIYEQDTSTVYTNCGSGERRFAFKLDKTSRICDLHFDHRTDKLLVIRSDSAELYNI